MEYNNPNLNHNANQNQNRIKNKFNKKNQIPKMEIKTSKFDIINSNKSSSKYLSSTSKKNPNPNYTIDSDNNKVLFNSLEEDNKKNNYLLTEIRIQNKILEQYQKWISTLLSVLNINNYENKKNNYDDIGSPIQKNLENIEKLKEENFKIKMRIIQQKIINENEKNILEKKKKIQNLLIKEFNEKNKINNYNIEEKIEKEKEQLVDNVQMLANELDEINENNKNFKDKIIKENKLKNIYDLLNIKKQLKEENKLYKKMIVLKNRKNYIDYSKEIFQENNDMTIDNKEIQLKKLNAQNQSLRRNISLGPISGFGEYLLEQEENIYSNGNIFLCGL